MHTSYIARVHHLKSIPDLMFLLRQYKSSRIANPAEAFCFSSLSVSCFTVTLMGSGVELLPLIFPVRAFSRKKSIAQTKAFLCMQLSGHELQFGILHLTNMLRLPVGPAPSLPPSNQPRPLSRGETVGIINNTC